jgi:hypothetical protein
LRHNRIVDAEEPDAGRAHRVGDAAGMVAGQSGADRKDLPSRWQALLPEAECQAPADEVSAAAADLLGRWGEPHRLATLAAPPERYARYVATVREST